MENSEQKQNNTQADYILKTGTNEGDIWYSSQYIKKQIELAFQAGIAVGAKIHIGYFQPITEQVIPDYTEKFWQKINEEYKEQFQTGHVWEVAGKRSITPR